MSDGLTTGVAVVLGGVFVGSVLAYSVSKCKKTNLTTFVKKKTAAVARKTTQTAANAKQAFSQGFAQAYHGTKETPVAAT